MPRNADRPDDDAAKATDSSTPNEFERLVPESTSDCNQVTPDPDATVIPGDDASGGDVSVTVMSDWEATLDADVEPGHTIKAPAAEPKKMRGSFEQTIALKRREVTQGGADGTAESAEVADADYQIEELLGEGGMGAVYAARQKSMDRPVAIKVLKSRAARLESSQEAFVSEAVITGRLDHPNIVPIYDVGKQPNDALFYAMKQVEGVEWKERFAENTVSENLDILLRVSDAIAFAHARGIIHRDLKPANIMLGPFGEVLVMDWGLAMPTEDHPSRESFPEARAGGTPHYMAPEMADGTERVDRRSDLYLLGAMLFEIVTGKPPHALDLPKGTRRARVLAVLDAVVNNVIAPTDQSGELLDIARKAIATEPADRYQTVPEFQAAIREYLSHEESIELAERAAERLVAGRQSGEYTEFSRARFGFETALEEWPENERAVEGLKETRFDYAKTAFDRGDFDLALSLIDESDAKQNDLGASIQLSIVDRDARLQQLRRLRRISLAASLTVALVAIGAAVWINSERDKALTEKSKALTAQQEEAAQRAIAVQNEQDAQKQRQVAETERNNADIERRSAEDAKEKATAAEAVAKREADNARRSLKIAERNAYYSDMLLLRSSWNEANIGRLHELVDRYRDRDDLKNFEWAYWDRQASQARLTLKEHSNTSRVVSFSPDGTRLAAAGYRNIVIVSNAVSGQQTLKLKGHSGGIEDVLFSPDGMLLASASVDGTVRLWSLTSGKQLRSIEGHNGAVRGVSFSPDGTLLASASDDRTVKIWSVATGHEKLTLRGHNKPVSSVTFSPNGTQLASAAEGRAKVWNLATGRTLFEFDGRAGGIRGLSFSPDGTRLASGHVAGKIKVWNVIDGESVPTLTIAGHAHPVYHVRFSPNGRLLASASIDTTVKIWDSVDGQHTLTLRGHSGDVRNVSFSPDGTQLASASGDGTVKVWDSVARNGLLNSHYSAVSCVSFSPDGTRLATGHAPGVRVPSTIADQTVRVWDVASRQVMMVLKGHQGDVTGVEFSSNGEHLASSSSDETVKIWEVATGNELKTLSGHTQPVSSVSFSPDGTRLASGSYDNTVIVWDTATGQNLLTLDRHTDKILDVSFSRDGTGLMKWISG